MTPPHDIPAGFVPLPDPDENARKVNIVPAEQLKLGAIVTYHGVQEWKSATGQPHRAHEFEDENGLFGLWGCAQLDRQLQQLLKGAKLYIRYEGLQEHPGFPGRAVHRWTLAPAAADLPSAPRTAA